MGEPQVVQMHRDHRLKNEKRSQFADEVASVFAREHDTILNKLESVFSSGSSSGHESSPSRRRKPSS
jgi:hypothetical protein